MPNEKHINKKHLAHLEVVRRQDRMIRISAIIIIVLVIGIVGYGILSNTVLMPYRSVASVNGENISAREFQQQVKLERIQTINQYMQYLQFAQMFGVQDPMNDANFGPILQQSSTLLNSTDAMGQQVLDLLINDVLTRQESKKRGISVSKDEVDKALQEGLNYFANGTPTL
jgi:parvulin-like peptidyl-prolyl isomerase